MEVQDEIADNSLSEEKKIILKLLLISCNHQKAY